MVTLPYHKDRMHDGGAPDWRQIIERHHANLADELSAQLEAEVGSSVALAISDDRERAGTELAQAIAEERKRVTDETGRRLSESLNQTLRRIRQTSAEHEALQLLLEDSAACAERAVVVLIENNQVRLAAWRGAGLRDEDADAPPIDLPDAAAIASCVGTRDPLVALASPAELSSFLASALSTTGADKVYLFPITVRQNTVAVMLACGEVTPAPIELLCEAVGMRLETLEAPVSENPVAAATISNDPLVQIAGVSGKEAAATTWTKLTPDEQALHLRAQRTAKVRVAQIRISESEALRKGTQTRDIYGALRPSIDAARQDYQQAYMSQTPTMVDYLHLEIVRSLAREDSRLLGQNYPGPIA